ncbi:hypothetical protein [Azospirillum sp.]|uniref:hypothetical protein n=1 Tax=Azospirillum sp. TaxID=34012 RepID=UPI002D3F98F8|nr:hypothetical protein [Azospirillum sp.]HYF87107.1 hypothetical protein [Azospirillum sp.]
MSMAAGTAMPLTAAHIRDARQHRILSFHAVDRLEDMELPGFRWRSLKAKDADAAADRHDAAN